ncbi:MAG TPA: ribbon-helix-helix protein, CopG family [Woeseiaceae bacterium]|nr:ribbon-helix-helix protein, CopG family [Woeseiaceae bacterium]
MTEQRASPSLPPDLAEQIEDIVETEGKSVSAFVQDALRLMRYRGTKDREKSILTEKERRRDFST